NLGRTTDALPLARRAYALAPGSAPAAALYGHLLASTGGRAAGTATLEKSLTLAPSTPLYRRWLATAKAR
nr:hypothetical protein [Sphingomonadaceae bacterium]